MFALVFEGKVVDVAVETFEVAPDLQWIAAPETVQAGWDYDGENFIAPPEVPQPELSYQVRAMRDQLLVASDWTQIADAPVNKTAWAEYRQALRDVPEQEGFPENVVWPTKPE
jgi:hypothetical protein